MLGSHFLGNWMFEKKRHWGAINGYQWCILKLCFGCYDLAANIFLNTREFPSSANCGRFQDLLGWWKVCISCVCISQYSLCIYRYMYVYMYIHIYTYTLHLVTTIFIMTFHHSDHDPWPMGIGNYYVTIIIAPLQENMPASPMGEATWFGETGADSVDHFWDNIVRPKRWEFRRCGRAISQDLLIKRFFAVPVLVRKFLLEGNFGRKMMMKRSFREGILSIYVAFFESLHHVSWHVAGGETFMFWGRDVFEKPKGWIVRILPSWKETPLPRPSISRDPCSLSGVFCSQFVVW